MKLVTLVVASTCIVGASPRVLAQITVGPPGSGASHQQIAAALAAAAPGATILVAAGSYEPFVAQQAVSIVGAGSDVCTIANPVGVLTSAIEIRQTTANAVVRVSGLAVAPSAESPEPRIALRQCSGRVEFVDVVSAPLTSGQTANSEPPKVLVEACAGVHFDDCELFGNGPLPTESWRGGSDGVYVDGSAVAFTGCAIGGGYGGEHYGGNGIHARNGSTVTLARSTVVGGDGGAHVGFYWWDIYCFQGADAIDAEDSQVVVAGGPGNLIEGGAGVDLSPYDDSNGGAAIRVGTSATARYASDAVLMRGQHGLGGTQGPEVETFGEHALGVAEAEERATLSVVPSAAATGAAIAIEASGRPFAVQLAVASWLATLPQPVPGAQFVHVDIGAIVPVAVLALDAQGLGAIAVTLPAAPALAGLHLTLQGVDLDLSTVRLSNPAQLVIR